MKWNILFFLFGINLCSLHSDESVFINTHGYINNVIYESLGLKITGTVWTTSDTDLIDTVKVYYLNKEKTFSIKVPSNSEQFNLRINLNDKELKLVKNKLITVVPYSSGKSGYPVYFIYDPRTPLPKQSEFEVMRGGALLGTGPEFLGVLVRCGLKKHHHVLDIGCAQGRTAYPIAFYLDSFGEYEGIDIIPSLIQEAKEFFRGWTPGVHFKLVDIYHPEHNPLGMMEMPTCRFPYGTLEFDYILLSTEFTHRPPDILKHYLKEIRRVGRQGSTCMASVYLINEESQNLIDQGKSSIKFLFPHGDCVLDNENPSEAIIGYHQTQLLEWLTENGFIFEKIHYGSWCGRDSDSISYPDIIIFKRNDELTEADIAIPREEQGEEEEAV